MKYLQRYSVILPFLGLLIASLPSAAQTPVLESQTSAVVVVDEPFDPNLPVEPRNDPGSEVDPSTLFDPATWVPIPADKLELDPTCLDTSTAEDALLAVQAGCTPGPGTFCGPQFYPAPGPFGCGLWNPSSSSPIRVHPVARNYFSYRTQLTPLLGASADNGCHLFLPSAGGDYCDQSNYMQVIDSFASRQLNKIRLWVALAGDVESGNQPFLQVEDEDLGTFWALDQRNPAFFDRLRTVVAYARSRGLFVEVTFFAPWIGDFNGFRGGPWGGQGRYGQPGSYGPLVKFTRWENFVQAHTVGSTLQLVDSVMEQAQRNVVEWTVEELWCYDHVYWELANEQEGYKCSSQEPEHPCTVLDTAKLQRIAAWNQLLITWLRAKEAAFGTPPSVRHLIAAQPFRDEGAVLALSNPNISVINGHYSTVSVTAHPQLDLGAIRLIRERHTPSKILGLNEGKIVQTFTSVDGTVGGGTYARTRWNDDPTWSGDEDLFWGVAASARAEAWEFLINQGGTVDHFGYRYDLANSRSLQGSMRHLLRFLRGLRLTELQRSSVPTGTGFTNPNWLAGWPAYPVGTAGWDATHRSQRFWAALEPKAGALKRQFVLYVHRSALRCKSGEYSASGCSSAGFLAFGGYDARGWVASSGQQYAGETLDLRLGGTAPTTYLLEWFSPATAGGAPLSTQTLHWTPSGSAGSCPQSLVPGKCVVQSAPYDFDVAVKITEQ